MMKAIILFSGGIDSTVVLAKALNEGRKCIALSFDYGQKHRIELDAAREIAKHYDISHHIIKIDPAPFSSSSLASELEVSKGRSLQEIREGGIPSTYVPARNTIFLSFALAFAESAGAGEIYIGANALDIHGYPDCRPAYFEAWQKLICLATKQSVDGHAPKIATPLASLNKAEIILLGKALKAPLNKTFSCYSPTIQNLACEQCDACILRADGFKRS